MTWRIVYHFSQNWTILTINSNGHVLRYVSKQYLYYSPSTQSVVIATNNVFGDVLV